MEFDFNHPAYLGYAKYLPEDDPRLEQYCQQLTTLGFDATYLWGLNCVIAKFVGSLLLYFADNAKSYPSHIDEKTWDNLLRMHGYALLEYVKISSGEVETTVEQDITSYNKAKKAFQFLAEEFGDLWS